MTDTILIKALNPVYRSNSYIWNMTTLGKLEAKYLQKLHDFTDKVFFDSSITHYMYRMMCILIVFVLR